jgi:hypothetical protein
MRASYLFVPRGQMRLAHPTLLRGLGVVAVAALMVVSRLIRQPHKRLGLRGLRDDEAESEEKRDEAINHWR